jgi:hypothetical protein
MDDARMMRLSGLAGIVGVVLFVISTIVVESSDTPDDDATAADIAAYFDGELGVLVLGLIIAALGAIALIWFLDGLRIRISQFSDQLGRLTFFFGFAAVLFLLASALPDVSAAFATDELDRELDPGAAEALWNLGDGFFFGAEMLLVGFFLFAGLAAVWARAWPAWLGWVSLVLAVIALIPPIGWAVVVFGFPLWILLVSALLWRRPAEPATAQG